MANAKRRREQIAVAVLNVVKFREINATYGLKAGDEVLKEIARRLTANLRGGDLVSRFMGDEFGVALVSIRDTSG